LSSGQGCPNAAARTFPAGSGAAVDIPLILYSPVSWLGLLLRMLNADDALDPTVSTLSNPGCTASAEAVVDAAEPGWVLSS
jgi:hypothetical protein